MEPRFIDCIGNEVKIGEAVAYVSQYGCKVLFIVAILTRFTSRGIPEFSRYDPIKKKWGRYRLALRKQHIKIHLPLGLTHEELQNRAFEKARERAAQTVRIKPNKAGNGSLIEKFWQELKDGESCKK
jgi:hypothetical protein